MARYVFLPAAFALGLWFATEDQAKAQGIKVKKGLFPWNASGRAIANGCDEGVTKLLLMTHPRLTATARSWRRHGRHACGDMIGGGLAIEMELMRWTSADHPPAPHAG